MLNYFGKGGNREPYLGIKIPPTNLKPDYVAQARAFGSELADRLDADEPTARPERANGPTGSN